MGRKLLPACYATWKHRQSHDVIPIIFLDHKTIRTNFWITKLIMSTNQIYTTVCSRIRKFYTIFVDTKNNLDRQTVKCQDCQDKQTDCQD